MSRCGDDTFGPAVSGRCRGGFDFTLLFEESILSISLSALLICFVPLRLAQILRRDRVTKGEALYRAKILAALLFAGLQLTTVVLWTRSSATRTRLSLVAAALSFVASGCVGILTHAEHLHTVCPSTTLTVYYVVSILCDITRARTLWLRGVGSGIPSVFISGLVMKGLLLLLELLDRTRIILPFRKEVTPEELSGVLKEGVFFWLNPLLARGFWSILGLEDLTPIAHDLRGRSLEQLVPVKWAKVQNKDKSNMLLMSTVIALKWPLLSAVFPRICFLAFTLAQPFLLTKAVQFVEGPTTQKTINFGYGLIGAYFLVYVGMAFFAGLYWHTVNRIMVMVRGSLIGMIYAKTMEIGAGNMDEAAALTLMSTDVENIILGFEDVHEVWANVVQAAIATWLLQRQLSWACIAPIIISIACFLGAASFAGRLKSAQRAWNGAIQTRLDVTSRMLGQMKEVKLMGMTDRIFSTIQVLREREITRSEHMRKLRIWVLTCSQATVVLGPVAAFALYALAAKLSHRDALLTGQAFTSLALIALLANPITILTQAVPSLASGIGCINRIQEFLSKPSGHTSLDLLNEPETSHMNSKPQQSRSIIEMDDLFTNTSIITVQNADFGWRSKGVPTLRNITFAQKPGSLTIVTGPVGCGKTTLLRGLLGELPEIKGIVHINTAAVSFCDQIPWLANGTVQSNIVSFSDFDQKWYDHVIQACALNLDFQQLPNGDQSSVGSKGISLSRGQKQRVAIARALYARNQVALFDDVLSGLDATTEEHVFRHVFGPEGLLHKLCATSLLVTHSNRLLPRADHVIVINSAGEIAEQGSFSELRQRNGGYVNRLDVSQSDQPPRESFTVIPVHEIATQNIEVAVAAVDLTRKTGDWTIYSFSLRAAGWTNTVQFIGASFVVAFLFNFPTLWLKWWSEANEVHPNQRIGMYLGIYFLLAVCAAAGVAYACWQMIMRMVSRSGLELHKIVLQTVMSAPLSFFVKTDTGITTNRLSQDMQLIDMVLPMATVNTVFFGSSCLVQIIIIAISANYMAVLIPVCGVVVLFVQKFYLRTSRQLRLLDLEAKSPLYSNFIESLSGLVTIRAFKWQEHFKMRNIELLDTSQVPIYLLYSVQRWLSLVLDLVVAGLAVILIVLAVKLKDQISGGSIGVALVNITTFNIAIVALVRFWTAMETSLGAVARVKSFQSQTASEIRFGLPPSPNQEWPSKGAIEFDGLLAFHNAGSEAVLKDLSFSVKAGEKVGICGRTGSGKSSLILSLFQMLDLEAGTIKIDDVDLAAIPLETVRSRLNCVTQEPLFVPGTVRLNADFSESLTDAKLTEAFRKVRLWDTIEAKGGLDVEMLPDTFSLGQQQLFCLARAMLRKRSILVLDEISSSVDQKTDDLMHQIIKEHFFNTTVIEVTHRLDSILNFDRVLLLDQGKLVEYDDPKRLLSTQSSFAKLYRSRMSE